MKGELIATAITGFTKSGAKVRLESNATYVNGTAANLDLSRGVVKGFSTNYDQSDDSTQQTLNVSSHSDQRAGVVNYFHTNNFLIKRGYGAFPNDGNFGSIGIESQDIEPSNCHSNSFSSDDSLTDTKHSAMFYGELA